MLPSLQRERLHDEQRLSEPGTLYRLQAARNIPRLGLDP